MIQIKNRHFLGKLNFEIKKNNKKLISICFNIFLPELNWVNYVET